MRASEALTYEPANLPPVGGSCKQPRASSSSKISTCATTLRHLVNICRMGQRKLQWDPKRELFVGDDEASKLSSRPRREGDELPEV